MERQPLPPGMIEAMREWRRNGHLQMRNRFEVAGFTFEYIEEDNFYDYIRVTGPDGTVFSSSSLDGNVYHLSSFLQGIEYAQALNNRVRKNGVQEMPSSQGQAGADEV